MKIEGPHKASSVGGARKSSAAAAPGFSVPAGGAGASAAAMEAVPSAPLDALMALQAENYDPHRRGRQVRRGRATLDALDALMRAALGGAAPNAERLTLIKLQSETEPTGDARLDAVLAEIDVRAAVELAKLDMADEARRTRL